MLPSNTVPCRARPDRLDCTRRADWNAPHRTGPYRTGRSDLETEAGWKMEHCPTACETSI